MRRQTKRHVRLRAKMFGHWYTVSEEAFHFLRQSGYTRKGLAVEVIR
jgi:hypothetical protein